MPRENTSGGISQEQLHNAAIIASVGQSMGATTRDIQIALMAALVESDLVNVDHGDADSLGLFQQRPSQGWGSAAQVMDPYYASHKFFKALLAMGNRRYGMNMGAAAQAVQRSAFPARYQEKLGQVRAIWPQVQMAQGQDVKDMNGHPYGSAPKPPPLIPETTTVIPWQGDTFDPSVLNPTTIPDTSAMLGAWGMNSPQVVSPNDGTKTLLTPETFTHMIAPMITGAAPPVNFAAGGPNGSFQKGVDGWRNAVLQAARSALGTPYVWGGNSLQDGVDCSGLVQQAYAAAGINLPRISFQQANSGVRVPVDQLVPGDLVAWNNSDRNPGDRADHIAIWLGHGNIIEAPRPGLAVRVSHIGRSLNGGYGVHMNG